MGDIIFKVVQLLDMRVSISFQPNLERNPDSSHSDLKVALKLINLRDVKLKSSHLRDVACDTEIYEATLPHIANTFGIYHVGLAFRSNPG